MIKIFQKTFFYFSILLISSSAFSASFDCKKAKSKSEIAICSDKELDELDSQLGSSYNELKKIYSTDFFKKVIVGSQRQWIKNNSNNDMDALKKNYRERINFLNTSAILVFGYKLFENKIDSTDPFISKIQKDADGIEIISSDLFLVKKEIIQSSEEARLTPRCFTVNKLIRKSDGKSLGFKDVFDSTKKNLIYEKIFELTFNQLKERGENVSKKEAIEEISQKLENDFNEVAMNSNLFSINHFLSRPSECADTEISMPLKELMPFLTPYMKKQLNGFK